MIRIAIVGNIASGKSTVEKILQKRGCSVLDTDKTGHELLENNQQIIESFKNYDILDNGKISRDKLGKLVFSNPELKEKLEEILHPLIRNKILEFFEQNKDKQKVFVSIPLLFEAGMENLFDMKIFIYTNDDIRLNRLITRNNYTEKYARIRMNSQINQDIKAPKCDVVIYNNSTIENLKKQVSKLF